MPAYPSNDPLHGVTLKALLESLVARHGWAGLAERVPLGCFSKQPSVKSSLKFLRRTPWARAKVEQLYLSDLRREARNRSRNEKRAERRAQAAAAREGGSPDPPDRARVPVSREPDSTVNPGDAP